MKINPDFVLRNIADEYIIVPVGEAASRLKSFIAVNELGAFIFRQLENDCEAEDIINAVLAEYDTEGADIREDCTEFIDSLKSIGAVDC